MHRLGAIAAIVGTVVSVAAGMGFGNLTNEVGAEQALRSIAVRPAGYWPTVHVAFMAGALLWTGAFAAIARTIGRGAVRTLGLVGVVAITVGAAVHLVDSSISGSALTVLAGAWADAAPADQGAVVANADTVLRLLNGTWPSVHAYFHGLPFVLMGLAVARSGRYPAWLGWAGAVGGAASLLAGVLDFYDVTILGSPRLYVVPAQVVSAWMIAMGVVLGRQGADISRSGA